MKRRPRSSTADRLPFTATALPFEFVAPLPIATCIARLKKMTVTEPPSDIAFFRIDAELQRFYLQKRAVDCQFQGPERLLQCCRDRAACSDLGSGQIVLPIFAQPSR